MAGSKGSKYYDIFLDYAIRLEHREKGTVLDPFKFRLLKAIIEKGSIKAAAAATGVSYRKAWGSIEETERLIGFRLVNRHRGGSRGGETTLTEDGQKLVESHEALRKDFDKAIYRITGDFFHTLND
jgi:molybdate transport system regulatory protein